MSSEQEEEREFLADLRARSGRTLAEWMAAITAQGFADKNETIDWLRSQGFPFARASWLERIHNNGGKPIYQGVPARKGGGPASAETASPPPAEKPPPAPTRLGSADAAQMEKLVAAAKGYRPLFQLLEAEIRRALPDVAIVARPTYLSLGAPVEFAALTLHATELRLGLALGDHPFDATL